MEQPGFLSRKFFQDRRFITIIWCLLPLIAMKDFFRDRYNNYKIFKGVFQHLTEGRDLYIQYPAEYGDTNHYGPLFAFVIAPFSVLPDVVGVLLWGLFNVGVLIYALRKLELRKEYEILLMLLCTVEVANTTWSNQFNPSVAAMLVMSYVMVEKKKDFWSPLFIMMGFFIKLYTIVGLLFFFFSKQKLKFFLGCVVWTIVMGLLPMLISSPQFVIDTYLGWLASLTEKTALSVSLTSAQDISVMGFVRRLTQNASIPNWPFLLVGALAVVLPLVRFDQYDKKLFRLYLLCSIMMFVVLFSPGSEHPTYVICVTGIFIWMITQPVIFTRTNIVLTVLVILWTGLSPSDLLTVPVRKFSTSYALKAVPCIIVWVMLIWQLMKTDFGKAPMVKSEERFAE